MRAPHAPLAALAALSVFLSCGDGTGPEEDRDYYWQNGWKPGSPGWLAAENPEWPGNYTVRYWDPEWQALIYGDDDSYTHRLLTAGFDGVYLDIIDAFEFFEQ